MNNLWKYSALLLASAFLFQACKDKEDDDTVAPPTNEEELITTLRLTFAEADNAANTYEMVFQDLDGDGGNAPVITADTLPVELAFSLSVEVLNESVSPAEDITAEIQAEDEAHQFFFQVSGANLSLSYADADGNGLPVGLVNTAVSDAASVGTLLVTLRHEPNKTGAGVATGDITNAGGETDLEVSFPIVIQ
jgi:hypothetical protein